MTLANATQEQRKAWLDKSVESRRLKKLAGENLIQDWGDDGNEWSRLASLAKFRLPPSHLPSSELKYVRKLLKKIDRDMDWCKTVFGYTSMMQFSKDNPKWNIVALCGLILEDWNDEIKNKVEYLDND